MKLQPGTPAPAFELPDVVTNSMRSLKDHEGNKGLVIIFLCRHCPYVVHVRDQIIAIAREYEAKEIGFVAISSNDPVKYPDDAPDKLRLMALECQMPFSVLFDESQDVARAYGAACTPDFFVFDADQRLYYRGRLDDSTPGNGRPVTGADLRGVLERLLGGQAAPTEQIPSMGCGIKWRD